MMRDVLAGPGSRHAARCQVLPLRQVLWLAMMLTCGSAWADGPPAGGQIPPTPAPQETPLANTQNAGTSDQGMGVHSTLPTVAAPTTEDTSTDGAGPRSLPGQHYFETDDRRAWLGKRLKLTPVLAPDEGQEDAHVLRRAFLAYPCDETLPTCKQGWAFRDLTPFISRYADGRPLTVQLPRSSDGKYAPPIRTPRLREVITGQLAHLCLTSTPPGGRPPDPPETPTGAPASAKNKRSTDLLGDVPIEPVNGLDLNPCTLLPPAPEQESIPIYLAYRMIAALAGLLTVLLVMLTTGLLTRNSLRGAVKEAVPILPGIRALQRGSAHQRSAYDLPLIRLAITQTNTVSLSMAQVLTWTMLVLFGQIYVWNLTDQFLTVSSDVLVLLGLGGATAVSSRITNSSRGFIPQAYLELVQRPGRRPRLGDLISVGGRPNIFKFQMLFFTATSIAMVLNELIMHCQFPILPAEYLTLMGISSGTYVINDWSQRTGWDELNAKIHAMDAHSVRLGHPVPRTAADLLWIKTCTDTPALRDFEEMLTRLRSLFEEEQEVHDEVREKFSSGYSINAGASNSPPPGGDSDA